MATYPGKFEPQLCSFIYRPHPIRGKGSLTPSKEGLKLEGMRSGEEERPALILGFIFFLVCASLVKLGLSITINWVALAGFLVLLTIFAYLTQKVRRKVQFIFWEATASVHTEEDDVVELLLKHGVQKRYLKFRFDQPKSAEFLAECREFRGD